MAVSRLKIPQQPVKQRQLQAAIYNNISKLPYLQYKYKHLNTPDEEIISKKIYFCVLIPYKESKLKFKSSNKF